MAIVNKVEYKADSLTDGFALAGDQVQITKEDAPKIDKDVKDNRTEDLNRIQKHRLEFLLKDTDKTEYDNGEEGENPEGEELPEEEFKKPNGAGGAASAAVSMLFGQAILGGMIAATPSAPWPTISGIAGPVALGLGVASKVNAELFDIDLGERIKYASEVDEVYSQIQDYIDEMNEDLQLIQEVESEAEEETQEADEVAASEETPAVSEEGGGEAAAGGEAPATLVQQLTELAAKYKEAEANGASADELNSIRQEMLALLNPTEGASEGEAPDAESPEELLDRIETTNSEAHELDDKYQSVSHFLKIGNALKPMAELNEMCMKASGILGGAFAAIGAATAAAMGPLAGLAFSTAANGIALSLTSIPFFANAASVLGDKADKEGMVGKEGDKLAEKLQELEGPMGEHDQLVSVLQDIFGAKESGDEEGGETSGTTSSTPTVPSVVTDGGSSGGSGGGES